MKLLKLVFVIMSVLLMVACTESKYTKMSDTELREKKRHCDSIPQKSTVFATGCENVKKEIKRRKKEK